MSPEVQVIAVAVGTAASGLLVAATGYIKKAANALEARNTALDAHATFAKGTAARQDKQDKDLREAWGRIRELEGKYAATLQRIAELERKSVS